MVQSQPLKLCQAAAKSAQKQPALSAFDPAIILAIINAFAPALVGLFTSICGKPTPAQVKLHVLLNYHKKNGTYSPRMLSQTVDAAHGAGHQSEVELSDEQALAVQVATFDAIRESNGNADIQAVLSAAA